MIWVIYSSLLVGVLCSFMIPGTCQFATDCGSGLLYCYNGGTCNGTHSCVCPPSYMGISCELEVCDPACENGQCSLGRCYCDYGFAGDLCDIPPGPECAGQYCWNGGICREDQCICTGTFRGTHCKEEICPLECLNNGTCYDQRCQCRYGFNGTRCEIALTIPCGDRDCWNNGTCDTLNQVCQCREPYMGVYCTEIPCVPECLNNGSCYSGYCSCPFGFIGERCETAVPTCDEYTLCYNGTCSAENNSCMCNPGYTGYSCADGACNPPCVNGSCSSGNCYCNRGFGGPTCEEMVTPACDGGLCFNGTCVNDTCVCRPGYRGRECYERDCVPECQNGGGCYQGNCTCRPPYIGAVCDRARQLCGGSTVCHNGECNGDACVCLSGYTGASCDRTLNGTTPSPNVTVSPTTAPTLTPPTLTPPTSCGSGLYCYNGGSCNGTHSCVCRPGFTGSECQSMSCDPACENGQCYSGRCYCNSGFAGDACDIPPGPECAGLYCWNGGICREDQCICTGTFRGTDCTEERCSLECLNNGTCYYQRCQCRYGFNGTRCEIALTIPCGDRDCWNNGTCDTLNQVCQCREPYMGDSCTERPCIPECLNNGSCYSGYCSCRFGFTGDRCETQLSTCDDSTLCYNGTCNAENNTCMCNPGYTGYSCADRACNPSCVNGYCGSGICYCNRGFGGPTCEEVVTPACDGGLCFNGTCVNDTCVCRPGYRGRECYERDCVPECQNGGGCYQGNCTCRPPYIGAVCDRARQLCGESTVCHNGECNGDTCVCLSGYTGASCDITLNPSPNVTVSPTTTPTLTPPTLTPPTSCGFGLYCYNGGSCNGTHNCVCRRSFTGVQCDSLSCDPPCENGQCTSEGRCYCNSGFAGDACDIPPGPECAGQYCWNGGICREDQCICTGTFRGTHCKEEICPLECLNNGTCYDQRCQCEYRFNGTRCEIALTIPCGDRDCWNNGTCDTLNQVCQCREPYMGVYCTEIPCMPECLNNGSCYSGYCSCPFGFTGDRCETQLSTCDDSTLCYNGTCNAENNTCMCNPGYTGSFCADRACNPPPCVNRQCYYGTCYCNRGFGGPTCEEVVTPACDGGLCFNGTCVNDTCVCRPGYRGRECNQRDCVPECQNGGGCYQGKCTCRPPYIGAVCDRARQLCGGSTVCHNGECNGDTCVCLSGYTGASCDRSVNGTTPSPNVTVSPTSTPNPPTSCGSGLYCYNGGSCNGTHSCVCRPGFVGGNCSVSLCNPPCEHGICSETYCSCDYGFSGDACAIPPGPVCGDGYCWNGGICSQEQCICSSTYNGPYCQNEICPVECLNGGLCSNQRCYCNPGFNGTACEIPPGVLCGGLDRYCWNNGTCDNEICQCRDPYLGEYCTNRRCEPECLNDGACYQGTCSCNVGFTGKICETEVTTCDEYTPCYNGTCNADNNSCMCLPGFRGYECSERDCPRPCMNGYCASSGSCYCDRGFGGETCEEVVTPRCGDGGLCFNGTCVDDTCVCRSGYRGRECYQRDCVPECQNGGGCYDGECTCRPPYTGASCERETQLCGGRTVCHSGNCDGDICACLSGYYGANCDRRCQCRNGGSCDNQGRCHCPYLYTGELCDVRIFCSTVVCLNGGSCNASTGVCICTEGYTGPYCGSTVTTEPDPPCEIDSQAITPSGSDVPLNFVWPATNYGVIATMSCPCAANPSRTQGIFATRTCGEQGRWRDTDYSACVVLTTYQRFCVNTAPVTSTEIDSLLANGGEGLTAADAALIANRMLEITETADFTDEVTVNMIVSNIDSLLNLDSEVLATSSETTQSGADIVRTIEEIGYRMQLAMFEVARVERESFSMTATEVSSNTVLPQGYLMAFLGGESCVLPQAVFTPTAVRVAASVIRRVSVFKGTNPNKVVASNVMSVSIQGRTVAGLSENVVFNLPKTKNTPEGWMDTCQFWDVAANGGIGDWSTDGCEMMSTVGSIVQCACIHLTSFAVVQVPIATLPTVPAPALANLLIIAVPAAGGGLLLCCLCAIVIAVTCCACKKRRRNKPCIEDTNATVMENMSLTAQPGADYGERELSGVDEPPAYSNLLAIEEPRYISEKELEALHTNTSPNL